MFKRPIAVFIALSNTRSFILLMSLEEILLGITEGVKFLTSLDCLHHLDVIWFHLSVSLV